MRVECDISCWLFHCGHACLCNFGQRLQAGCPSVLAALNKNKFECVSNMCAHVCIIVGSARARKHVIMNNTMYDFLRPVF